MTKTQKAKKYRLGNEPGQIMPTNEVQDMNIKRAALNLGLWHQPVQVTRNNFIHKSLSDFALNFGIGCTHGCLFCYVPDTSTKKQGPTLKHPYGVQNPDAEWGKYAFLRPWDEDVFLKSLRQALMTPANKLSWDGHSAIMLCTTTDPYQTFHGHRDQKRMNAHQTTIRRTALELIRTCSDLKVRILTRSPLVKSDFDILILYGNGAMLGMSIPTLNDTLAKVYEPGAPSVKLRLETLRLAKEKGIPIYVAIAPTYAECDPADLEATLKAVAELDPVCIYHEPINIRAENVKRIAENARRLGITLKTEVFATPGTWRRYAMGQLFIVQRLSEKLGVIDRLKLWPDADLKTKSHFMSLASHRGRNSSVMPRFSGEN